MKIIRSIKKMAEYSRFAHLRKKTLGLVPTMGALHEGHLSLIRQARGENDLVIVSIFVNPTQFAPNEDFKKYPRNLTKDANLCEKEKADVIFSPSTSSMYPKDYETYVFVEKLGDCLCGKSRPGHFKGVATVVTKLFNIISPDTAYFGQKDAQQAIIIKKLVEDLNMQLKVKVMPTVRQSNGLALSSRNTYLNAKEKLEALALPRSLSLAEYLIKNGLVDADRIIRAMEQLISKRSSGRIDYISIVDNHTLKPLKKISSTCLIAVAVSIGNTRLIDNRIIRLK